MLLELTGVGKTYRRAAGSASGSREVRALDDVSLSIDEGEFVAVQGPSGCGKTTLLLIAGALLEPGAGRVQIAGEDPYKMRPDERARFRAERIGFVFQQFHLVPYLSVLDNVRAPAIAAKSRRQACRRLLDSVARAEELVRQFQLEHRRHHVPGELSTGERQRTALARALLNRPKLLLADEPTGNLDRENAEIVLGYLREFAAEGGGVLLVTHDSEASASAHRIIRLRDGRIEPLAQPLIRESAP